jgi:hypothetical protein
MNMELNEKDLSRIYFILQRTTYRDLVGYTVLLRKFKKALSDIKELKEELKD